MYLWNIKYKKALREEMKGRMLATSSFIVALKTAAVLSNKNEIYVHSL